MKIAVKIEKLSTTIQHTSFGRFFNQFGELQDYEQIIPFEADTQ